MEKVIDGWNNMPKGQKWAFGIALLWAIMAVVRQMDLNEIPAAVPGVLAFAAFLLAFPWRTDNESGKSDGKGKIAAWLQRRGIRVNIPAGLLVLWLGISIALHPYPLPQLRCMRWIFLTFSMLLLSPIVVTDFMTRIRKAVLTLILALLAVGAAVSLFIWLFIKVFGVDETATPLFYFGYCGLLSCGITFSHICGILTLVSLYALLHEPRKRGLSACSMIMFLCGCMIGGSRIALCGTAAGFLLLVGFHFRKVLNFLKSTRGILLTLGVIGAMAAASPWLTETLYHKQLLVREYDNLLISRHRLWNARIYEITHYPLTGIGYANELQSNIEANVDCAVTDDFAAIIGPAGELRPELYVAPDASATAEPDASAETAASAETDAPSTAEPRLKFPVELEPGSSWYSVVSSGGVVAAILLIWFLIGLFRRIRANRYAEHFPLGLSILVFFLFSSFTEGWIIYAGSFQFMIFWLTVSLISAPQNSERRTML